jgi:hypothetical protein
MIDMAFVRGFMPTILLAATISVAAPVIAFAQTPTSKPNKSDQVNPKAPAAPTEAMESPEVPKKPDGKAPPKDFGTPHPPEQPYPSKATPK